MRCPNCNKEITNPNLRFCTACGSKLPERRTDETYSTNSSRVETTSDFATSVKGAFYAVKHEYDEVKKKYDGSYTVPKRLTPDVIAPCNDEKHIKQYSFAKMKLPIVGYNAEGVVQVTNKRIIYNKIGVSRIGKEHSHSEFSIDDVAAVTVEKSTSINIWFLILAILTALPMTLMGLSVGLASGQSFLSMVITLGLIALSSWLLYTKHYVWMYLATIVGVGYPFGAMIRNSMMSMINLPGYGESNDSAGIAVIVCYIGMIALSVLLLIAFMKNLFKLTISLVVSSKSGGATPIDCSGSKMGILNMNNLGMFVYMYETPQTDIVAKELGAMVSDIQKYGDYGISKWTD